MLESKQIIVIAREWKNPQIHTWVSDETIGVSVSVEDYLKALAEEIGNPTLILTKAQLLERLQQASSQVITTLKTYTTRVL